MLMLVRRYLGEERGAEAIEYGLLASLIMLAIVGAVTLFANNTNSMWDHISAHMASSAAT